MDSGIRVAVSDCSMFSRLKVNHEVRWVEEGCCSFDDGLYFESPIKEGIVDFWVVEGLKTLSSTTAPLTCYVVFKRLPAECHTPEYLILTGF